MRHARDVARLCNHTVLAATLMGPLGIEHPRLKFSRDVMSQTYTYPCAIHTWPEGYTFIDSTGTSIYELATHRVSRLTPDPKGERIRKVKAFMQKAYDDMNALK